ncbi:hypothetical protein HO995_10700 [Streptococcus suis]|nr:hypothetical protein [Streptococcus suis]
MAYINLLLLILLIIPGFFVSKEAKTGLRNFFHDYFRICNNILHWAWFKISRLLESKRDKEQRENAYQALYNALELQYETDDRLQKMGLRPQQYDGRYYLSYRTFLEENHFKNFKTWFLEFASTALQGHEYEVSDLTKSWLANGLYHTEMVFRKKNERVQAQNVVLKAQEQENTEIDEVQSVL